MQERRSIGAVRPPLLGVCDGGLSPLIPRELATTRAAALSNRALAWRWTSTLDAWFRTFARTVALETATALGPGAEGSAESGLDLVYANPADPFRDRSRYDGIARGCGWWQRILAVPQGGLRQGVAGLRVQTQALLPRRCAGAVLSEPCRFLRADHIVVGAPYPGSQGSASREAALSVYVEGGITRLSAPLASRRPGLVPVLWQDAATLLYPSVSPRDLPLAPLQRLRVTFYHPPASFKPTPKRLGSLEPISVTDRASCSAASP